MTPEEYGAGDWTHGEIACAQALWEHNNPHKPVHRLHPNIADAWMMYLPAARVAFSIYSRWMHEIPATAPGHPGRQIKDNSV